MSYRDRYEQWIAELPADDPMREELIAIRDNDEEIRERFYTEIEFGTAGLRGIRGAGTNRMNRLTVGRATQGIANYILASGEDKNRGMVLAYDCRYFSKEFAELAAQIFAGNGIKAYLFPSHRPTPELSFAIRSFALRDPQLRGARRHQHDGQPQSQGIQRLQGLLDGRRADLGGDL